MKKQMSIRVRKTITSFLYQLVGVILPFLICIFIALIFQKEGTFERFLDEGQFLLFSAGLITNAIFLFRENPPNDSTGLIDKILGHTGLIIAVFSSIAYAAIFIVQLLSISEVINVCLLRTFSLTFFVLSCIALFRGIYIEYAKSIPTVDIPSHSQTEVGEIMDQLNSD